MWKWLNDTTRGAICSGPHLGKAGNVCPPHPHLECVIQQNRVGTKGLHPPGSPRMLMMLAQEAPVRTAG